MVHDIETMKALGFTMLRKHVKVEPLRWYAHCDRLGMLVWQDVVNGGGRYRAPGDHGPAGDPVWVLATGRTGSPAATTPPGRAEFRARGARDGRAAAQRRVAGRVGAVQRGLGPVRRERASPTRCADARPDPAASTTPAAGSTRAAATSASLHVYLRPFRMPRRRGAAAATARVLALTEYGGYSLRVGATTGARATFGYQPLRDAEPPRGGVRRGCTSDSSRPRSATGSAPPSTPSSPTSRTSSTAADLGPRGAQARPRTWSTRPWRGCGPDPWHVRTDLPRLGST